MTRSVGLIVGAATAIVAVAVVILGLALGGGSGEPSNQRASFAHVHGLGVDPADGALFIATHEGMFRSAVGESSAEQVGDSNQDVMGFAVVGRGSFLASGHPGFGQGGPSNLGLIRSDDAGKTWSSVSVSLAGGVGADLHILRAHGQMVYGLNSATGELLVSKDRGSNWAGRAIPNTTVDVAVDPGSPRRAVATTPNGVYASRNAAASWSRVGKAPIGLLAWASNGRIYLVDESGTISTSVNGGRTWQQASTVGGLPTAIAATSDGIYVALADNTILQSVDNGATWKTRAKP